MCYSTICSALTLHKRLLLRISPFKGVQWMNFVIHTLMYSKSVYKNKFDICLLLLFDFWVCCIGICVKVTLIYFKWSCACPNCLRSNNIEWICIYVCNTERTKNIAVFPLYRNWPIKDSVFFLQRCGIEFCFWRWVSWLQPAKIK